jgi:hypothetical protein
MPDLKARNAYPTFRTTYNLLFFGAILIHSGIAEKEQI